MENSSPSRVAGVCIRDVTVGGVSYTLSQADKVRKAADEEAVVIGRRLDMLPALARACMELPEAERSAWRREYISAMLCGIASSDEWNNYYNSPWNIAFRFWNALDPKHREGRSLLAGVAWAYEIVTNDDVTKDEMDALWLGIRMVSQEAAIKNS